jgi:chromosome segregation ATPase
MAASLTLSVVEIVVLLLGAIILGITIHFFITSRRNLRIPKDESGSGRADLARNEWKQKYFNDMELKDREITALTNRVNTAEENADQFAMELDDFKKANRTLKAAVEAAKAGGPDENTQQLIAALREEIKDLQEQVAYAKEVFAENNNKEQHIIRLREQNDQLHQQLSSAQQHHHNEEDNQSVIAGLKEQNDQLRGQLVEMSRHASSQDESAQHLIAELRSQNQQLQEELSASKQVVAEEPAYKQDDYLSRLMEAQHSLLEHNQKINELLGNIEVIKEKEEMQQEMARTNEELAGQIDHMRQQLADKESEINTIRQKETLSKEMSAMLDHAYSDFNILQDKIRKLEAQLTSSRMQSLEFEDLKEEQIKLTSDIERYRQKSQALTVENLQLQQELNITEDKLKEANLQRQQLQKKVAYLEEINNDLQLVSDANKKLEGQLRRIGELESMLNMVSEERDQLKQQHGH